MLVTREGRKPAMTVAGGARFEGKVLFATGGASGLARAVAQRFTAEGGRVAVADMDAGRAQATAADLDGAIALELDVADETAVKIAVACRAGATRVDRLPFQRRGSCRVRADRRLVVRTVATDDDRPRRWDLPGLPGNRAGDARTRRAGPSSMLRPWLRSSAKPTTCPTAQPRERSWRSRGSWPARSRRTSE